MLIIQLLLGDVPRYVHLRGFLTEGLTYFEDADRIRVALTEAHDHTDETLARALTELVEGLPAVRLWVLAQPEDDSRRCGTLHEAHASGSSSRQVQLDAETLDPVAARILGGAPAFPDDLEHRSDWYPRLTSGSLKQRMAVAKAAGRLAKKGRSRDPEERERRKVLIPALAKVLRDLPLEDAVRPDLWTAVSWLDVPSIHSVVLDALRAEDPGLTDGVIERQRNFVMQQLPIIVGRAMDEGDASPWVARARAILERWKIEPEGRAARLTSAINHLECAIEALRGARRTPEGIVSELQSLKDRLQSTLKGD